MVISERQHARHTINARRSEYYHDDEEGSVAKNYRPLRGGHYDNEYDWSMSPEPLGPKVFTFGIRSSRVPSKYRPPTNITKYGGETDPGLWLEIITSRAGREEWNAMCSSYTTFHYT